jgi:hypothetical protein
MWSFACSLPVYLHYIMLNHKGNFYYQYHLFSSLLYLYISPFGFLLFPNK